jgi:hypothetical protein
MILTTILAYIFSYWPSTHWSIAIQATCKPGLDFARANSSIEVVLQKLTANYATAGQTSVWSLQDLKSIIFSFQCKLRASHRLFQHRPQLQHVRASDTHKQIEFNLEAG